MCHVVTQLLKINIVYLSSHLHDILFCYLSKCFVTWFFSLKYLLDTGFRSWLLVLYLMINIWVNCKACMSHSMTYVHGTRSRSRRARNAAFCRRSLWLSSRMRRGPDIFRAAFSSMSLGPEVEVSATSLGSNQNLKLVIPVLHIPSL